MAEMRRYAKRALEDIFPGRGEEYEGIMFTELQNELETHNGLDFHDFRKEYKRLLKTLLVNYRREDSLLKKNLLNEQWSFKTVLHMNKREFHPDLWMITTEADDLVANDTEVREGLYACSNCQRKGQYARNTEHHEKQTRSADEPMTIFMHCFSCGKDARFSS